MRKDDLSGDNSLEQNRSRVAELLKRNKELFQAEDLPQKPAEIANEVEAAESSVISKKQESQSKNELASEQLAKGEQFKKVIESVQTEQVEEKEKSWQKQANEIANIKDPEQVVHQLLELGKQDPYKAVKMARHIDNNYVTDMLHGELLEDQVRNKLIEVGIVPKL